VLRGTQGEKEALLARSRGGARSSCGMLAEAGSDVKIVMHDVLVYSNSYIRSATQINVVQNWFEELKRRVPSETKW
jgi:hypothetical protein